jgi:two-component system chemotaxis response regulator CheB
VKFDSSLYLKWIDANSVAVQGADYTLTNLCVLCSQNAQKQITGFTAFEPRALDAALVERLEQRQLRTEFKDQTFIIYIPDFIKHRVEKLFSKSSVQIKFTSFLNITQAQNRFYFRDKLRIINVDDSPVLLKFLKHALTEIGFAEVIAQISDPKEAVEKILKLKPDLVTMDIQMPGMTGVEVVKQLLSKEPFPVIMISSLNMEEGSLVFDALNEGAFDYIQKPKLEDKALFVDEFKLKLLAAVSCPSPVTHELISTTNARKRSDPSAAAPNYPKNLVWCIGSSTGGTQALTRIFTSMPEHVPPVLIVQHIPPVFSRAFAESLNNLVPFKVKEAEDGEMILPDHVYIAAGGMQMGVAKKFDQLQIVLSDSEPVNRFKPSVDYLFQSLNKTHGFQFVAAILTGMGKDGAEGMLALKKNGARTLAQDERSCAVYGMPRAAVELNAVDRIVPIDDFAQALLTESAKSRKVS